MSFVEILETKVQTVAEERVRVSRRRRLFLFSLSMLLAQRLGIKEGSRCRVLIDMEAFPRMLRILIDPNGPHRFGHKSKGGATVSVPIEGTGDGLVPIVTLNHEISKAGRGIDVELTPALAQCKLTELKKANASSPAQQAALKKDQVERAAKAVPYNLGGRS